MENIIEDSLERKVRKNIMPNVLMLLGASCYVLADTFFVSIAAGVNGLAALNLTLPIYGMIFAIGSMIGVGSATRYKLYRSLGHSEADSLFSNALFWSGIISLLFILAGLLMPELLLQLMGADESIVDIGASYLRTILMCAPFLMWNYTFTAFARNDGGSKVITAAIIGSGLFNVALDYILMFPLGMGMFGAALATGLSPIVSIGICMLHYLSKRNHVRPRRIRPSFRGFTVSCALGTSAFVGEFASAVTSLVFNLLFLNLGGNAAVAAYAVVANLALIGMAIFNGISQGMQPMAGAAQSAGDTTAKQLIYKHSVQMGLVVAMAIVFILWALAEPIVSIFNFEGSAEMVALAANGLRLYSIGFIIAVINITEAGFYGAIGRTRECMILSLSRGLFAIVFFGIVMSQMFGIIGVWLAFPATELFTLLLAGWLETRRNA